MLNKLLALIRRYAMLQPGDTLVCAVSGGADSMALLWAMYLLKDKLGIRLEAAHFNHGLRGDESERDAAFVADFCQGHGILLHIGAGRVQPGKKGLEAAAREARYGFLHSLPGKIATAHTADDNAETVLMHLVRGTGLKGLGGIAPVRGQLIRPMLTVTRQEVLDFLAEYHLTWVEDSSNQTDQFLRNRLRHRVMPLLARENPRLAENLSEMAMDLREDEKALSLSAEGESLSVSTLRQLPDARRSRALADFLQRCGVKEPEREHIALANSLVFSQKPSAQAQFPGGITVRRSYDCLEKAEEEKCLPDRVLPCPGMLELPEAGLRVISQPVGESSDWIIYPVGDVHVRSRQPGDEIRLYGGSKSLKKLFVDRKIPRSRRGCLPVVCDDHGLWGVYGIGVNQAREAGQQPGFAIRFEPL